jgi:DNA glycosylase AlkZ-like
LPSDAEGGDPTGWLALPGFDEYMLGYKDRSMMASASDLAAIIPGGNGVFQSTLVRDGRVVATWKRVLGPRGVTVTVLPLSSVANVDLEAVLKPFAAFLGVPLTVKNP